MKIGQLGWMLGSVVLALGLVAGAQAGEEKAKEKGETKLKIGEAAPDFSLTDVKTGETVSLSDFKGQKTVVITFQSVTCPWNFVRESAGYERVLLPLATEMASKDVVFLAINSNSNEPAEKLKTYVEEHNMTYPILKDPGNQVADAYGAQTTPHFFVVDTNGVLRYQGGFERAPQKPEDAGQIDEAYLVPAINAILDGKDPEHTVTKSKGCAIKRAG